MQLNAPAINFKHGGDIMTKDTMTREEVYDLYLEMV